MGASLSQEHLPEKLQEVKDAEKAVLEYYNISSDQKGHNDDNHLIVCEEWLDLPSESHERLHGVKKIRCIKVGENKGDRVVLCIHGGGGIPTEWAPLFPHLNNGNNKAANKNDYSFWFLERPGHGISDPFDYLAIADSIDKFHADLLDAVRMIVGVDKIDVVGNSMGGGVIYWYAKHFPDRIRSFTWVGSPAVFQGQNIPFSFRVLATWFGTQIMAMPPPKSAATDLIFGIFNQDKEKVPQCFIDLYWAFMSNRNNSLSWNYMLRALFQNKNKYFFEMTSDNLKGFSEKFPCHMIVGDGEAALKTDHLKSIENAFGKESVVVRGQGHLPWLEDPEGVAEALVGFLSL